MSALLDLTLAGSRIATTVGVALILTAVAGLVWLRWSARRARQEILAEVGRPRGYWHPSMGPQRRPEPVTELLPRRTDDFDATVVIPRQRQPIEGGCR